MSARSLRFWIAIAAVCLARTAAAQVGGVAIDADGILRDASVLSQSDRLKLLQSDAVEPSTTSEINVAAPLRKVSLKKLEQTVAELHVAGKPLPTDVRFLAGLQEVRYVFFTPESGDVVLA